MTEALPTAAASALVLVTLQVAGQLCGVPVGGVRDILGEQPITPIPLAPPEVAGSLNLRGRIVTAIDLRRRLRLPAAPPGSAHMAVVTERDGELYALLVDQVVEVLTLDGDRVEPNPPTLCAVWSHFSQGVYSLKDALMVILDVDRLLAISSEHTA